MSIDQVVPRQVHRGMVHRVNKVGLHHGIVGMLHRIGCVDYIHLERGKSKHTHAYGHKMWSTDLKCITAAELHNASVTFRNYLYSSIVNASMLCDVADKCSVIPRP